MDVKPTEEDYARIEDKRGSTIRGTVTYYDQEFPAVMDSANRIWYWGGSYWTRGLLLTKKHFTPVGTT